MAGFALVGLLAIGALLFVTAEDWWPMGGRILGRLLVFAVLGLAITGAELFWSI